MRICEARLGNSFRRSLFNGSPSVGDQLEVSMRSCNGTILCCCSVVCLANGLIDDCSLILIVLCCV